MERTGTLLAVVALCWGGADTAATFVARKQGAFITTSISLLVSAAVLVIFAVLPFAQTGHALTPLPGGIGIGIFLYSQGSRFFESAQLPTSSSAY